MAIQFTTVRGRKYDFSSIEFAVIADGQAAQIFIECTAIDYDDTVEESLMYGTNPAPIGRTRGQYNPGEATVTVSKQTEAVLVDQLGDGYMEAEIDITIKYADTGLPLVVDTLERCRIVGLAQSHSSGTDALVTAIKMKPLSVLRNGKTPMVDHLR
jgi:hypothetical protein